MYVLGLKVHSKGDVLASRNRSVSRKVFWIITAVSVCALSLFTLKEIATRLSEPFQWTGHVRADSALITQLEELTGAKSDGFEQGFDDSSGYLRLFLRFPKLNDASKLENALGEIAAKRKWKSVEHEYFENAKCYVGSFGGTKVSVSVDFGLGIVGPAPGLSIHFAESAYGRCNTG